MANHIQKQIIFKALSDPLFARDVFPKLPVSTFSSEDYYQELATMINRYYQTASEPLDKETLLVKVDDKMDKANSKPEKRQAFYDSVTDIYTIDPYDQNEETINDTMEKYIRKTLISQTMLKAVANGKLEDENMATNLIKQLQEIAILNIARGSEGYLDFFKDKDKKKNLLRTTSQNKYKIGWDSLDHISDGGLARGEMGLVNASYGSGKTQFLVNIGRNYIRQGLNVLFLPLEEKLDRMSLRFETVLSGQPRSNFVESGVLNTSFFDQAQTAYGQMLKTKDKPGWGRLFIDPHKPREFSPTSLEQAITNFTLILGEPIDVVIIDYPDLMNNPYLKGAGDGESKAGGMLFEDIRRIMQVHNCIGWVASQLNRAGDNVNILKTAQMIEGSKQKLNPVEIAMTINQLPEESAEGYTRLYVDKMRYRSDANFSRVIMFKYDQKTGIISDERPWETEEHQALLEDYDASVTGVYSSAKKEKVKRNVQGMQNMVDNFNTNLDKKDRKENAS